MNFMQPECSPTLKSFEFEVEKGEMHRRITEKLNERAKIGHNTELITMFGGKMIPDDKQSVFALRFNVHKKDFGSTFGFGLIKLSKSSPFWIYFPNQGLFTKLKWTPP